MVVALDARVQYAGTRALFELYKFQELSGVELHCSRNFPVMDGKTTRGMHFPIKEPRVGETSAMTARWKHVLWACKTILYVVTI